MSSDWYYANTGERVGPVTENEFHSLRQNGLIGPRTLVWREGLTGWLPLSEAIVNLASDPAEGGICTVCAGNVGAENLIAFQSSRVCADCKDNFFRRVREQGLETHLPGARFAGFWIRLLARFLDALIIVVVTWPLSIGVVALTGLGKSVGRPIPPAQLMVFFGWWGAMTFVLWLLEAVYEAFFLSKRGGTPGKLILGLRVVRPDGERLTFWRGFARFFAHTLSSWILGIGYVMAAFDEEKRALHDRVCDTRVVYKVA
jgi:uncharacterized RDD family membrane protein YckC